jgi:hypothetical protein
MVAVRLYAEVPDTADVQTVKANLVAAAVAAGCPAPETYMQMVSDSIELLVWCPSDQEAPDHARRQ